MKSDIATWAFFDLLCLMELALFGPVAVSSAKFNMAGIHHTAEPRPGHKV